MGAGADDPGLLVLGHEAGRDAVLILDEGSGVFYDVHVGGVGLGVLGVLT